MRDVMIMLALVALAFVLGVGAKTWVENTRAYNDQVCQVTNESGTCPTILDVIGGQND